jgi:hypothetical protein
MKIFKNKNRKKKATKTIKIVSNDIVVYDGDLYELPIKKQKVIAGSVEFFNDPEPCMIHRSAVISRYYMMIENWLEETGNLDNDQIEFCSMPDDIVKLLDI